MLTVSKAMPKSSINQKVVAVLILYAALFTATLNSYIQWQSVNFITGIIAIPLIVKFTKETRSARYGIFALIFGLISLLLPINTILYFSFLFSFLFVIEAFYGKTNLLLLFLLIFLSPVFQYFVNVFSFPIRLQLTEWAGGIMNMIGIENQVQGNIIFCRGNEFSVDPTCMGLNMLLLSLIAAVVILSRNQNILQTRMAAIYTTIVFIAALLLNVFANLLRIVLIVQFNILPGTVLHEITGIGFFLIYIIIPMFFVVKGIASLTKPLREAINTDKIKLISIKKTWVINCMLILLLLISSFRNIELKNIPVKDWEAVNKVNEYSAQTLPHQVLKLERKGSLVYIKKIPAFYNADHTPYICWKGSGYTFQKIEKHLMSDIEVYAGKLKNGKEELFTAWWYQGKDKSTTSQFDWRWDMLTGRGNYAVINVTTTTEKELIKEVSAILKNNSIRQLIN